jgi:DNA-binding transcriptional regulator YhcF (GntR family)
MHRFTFINESSLNKAEQIARTIAIDIDKGLLKKDTRLPSINEFSEQYTVARDTIERAYRILKKEGYITSVNSKGYYVVGRKEKRIRVLLVFNKLSSYKKIVYDAIVNTLGAKAKVDLHIHHYDPKTFEEIIDSNLGKYHYYVVMPHFFHSSGKSEYVRVLRRIPENQLVLLDKNVPELNGQHMAVYQDFKTDIYHALCSANDLLEKYNHITIVFPSLSNHPKEIVDGAKQFCKETKKKLSIVLRVDDDMPQKGTAYIVVSEADLAHLIKRARTAGLRLGRDTGIISFNETVLKELLDITVITTDFEEMGRSVAQLIIDRSFRQLKNPFYMIRRKSL